MLILIKSMEKEEMDDELTEQSFPVRLRQDQEPDDAGIATASGVTRRRRSLRSSTSVDPQLISSAKSKKMIEKWYWSYPPPKEEATDFPSKSSTSGNK